MNSQTGTSAAEAETKAVAAVVAKVQEVAVLPQVVFRLVEATGAAEAGLQEIERTISVDPGFTAKVLAMANSAFYALPRKVASIREAVQYLGTKGVREIAMAASVFDMFVGKTDAESLRRRTWWRQSLDAATCAKWLGQELRSPLADVACTCALLHLIGKTVLDRSDPAAYEKVMFVVSKGAGDRQAERAVFGCDHIGVAAGVAGRWGFPEALRSGRNYAEPAPDGDDAAEVRAIVAIAHQAAVRSTDGGADTDEEPLPLWALLAVRAEPSEARRILDGAAEAIGKAGRAA
jgi:HD-like signal output (HDOD) protein